jgi:alpha-ketoglutarate-dependent taurine dioxygenase
MSKAAVRALSSASSNGRCSLALLQRRRSINATSSSSSSSLLGYRTTSSNHSDRQFGRIHSSSSTCHPQSVRKLSSSVPQDKQDVDESSSTRSSFCDYKATTLSDGSAISLDKNSSSSALSSLALFHAPWLWVNDPLFIHPSSGQKLRTFGQFPGAGNCRIAACAIVSSAHAAAAAADTFLPLPPPPPPPGSLHPIGGIYSTRLEETNHNNSSRWLLQVTWDTTENDKSTTTTSYYDLDWLLRCRYNDKMRLERLDKMRITSAIALGATHNPHCQPIQRIHYNDLMNMMNENETTSTSTTGNNNESGVLKTLEAVMEYGAVLIDHVPDDSSSSLTTTEPTVGRVGRILSGGSLSHGALYGDIFHVQSAPKALNIAYTSRALPPHQDMVYYESKPFLQLLHCVQNSPNVGGESTLMDGMAAAHAFRQLAPDLFDILVECNATFVKQRQGADMVSTKPHIQLSALSLSSTSTTSSNTNANIVSVHWAPPFEGPLWMIPPDMVNDYVVAYGAFETMLDNSLPVTASSSSGGCLDPSLYQALRDYAHNYTWEYSLKPGQMLVFNNQRMLHGRRGFSIAKAATTPSRSSSTASAGQEDEETPGRHLIGCYTGAEDTLSRYRLLLRDQPNRDARVIRNAGNGTSGSP